MQIWQYGKLIRLDRAAAQSQDGGTEPAAGRWPVYAISTGAGCAIVDTEDGDVVELSALDNVGGDGWIVDTTTSKPVEFRDDSSMIGLLRKERVPNAVYATGFAWMMRRQLQ